MGKIYENKLIEYLKNHHDERLNKLLDTELSYIINISDFDSDFDSNINSIEKLIEKYDILIDPPSLFKYNIKILGLVQSRFDVIIFKIFTSYTIYTSILFFLIYPILINNYLYYFFIFLLPISFMANGIAKIKTLIKKIFEFVLLLLVLVTIYYNNYEMLPIVIMFYLSKKLTQKGKENYRNLILNAALKNKLYFKFLFVIGLINLFNRDKNNFVRCNLI